MRAPVPRQRSASAAFDRELSQAAAAAGTLIKRSADPGFALSRFLLLLADSYQQTGGEVASAHGVGFAALLASPRGRLR